MKKPELVILGTILILTIVVDIICTKQVDLSKANTFTSVFNNLERYQVENKISYSYRLYTLGQTDPYVIAADYVNCFDIENFNNNINSGDTIIIKTEKLGLIRNEFVVSVSKNNINYVDLKCINDDIASSKKTIPLIGLGILLLTALFFWYNR